MISQVVDIYKSKEFYTYSFLRIVFFGDTFTIIHNTSKCEVIAIYIQCQYSNMYLPRDAFKNYLLRWVDLYVWFSLWSDIKRLFYDLILLRCLVIGFYYSLEVTRFLVFLALITNNNYLILNNLREKYYLWLNIYRFCICLDFYLFYFTYIL